MYEPASSRSRAMLFGQGVLTVIALAILGLYLPFSWVATRGSQGDWPQTVLGASCLLAMGTAVGLAIRWWTPLRWRAYGLLSALIGPPVLAVVLVILFFATGGQIGPR